MANDTKQVLLRLSDAELEQLDKIKEHYKISTVNQTVITMLNNYMGLLDTVAKLRQQSNEKDHQLYLANNEINNYSHAWQTLNRLSPPVTKKAK